MKEQITEQNMIKFIDGTVTDTKGRKYHICECNFDSLYPNFVVYKIKKDGSWTGVKKSTLFLKDQILFYVTESTKLFEQTF